MRESSRRNKDGSKATYLQLTHNERHPVTGSPVAKVIHNFGRKDKVDKDVYKRQPLAQGARYFWVIVA